MCWIWILSWNWRKWCIAWFLRTWEKSEEEKYKKIKIKKLKEFKVEKYKKKKRSFKYMLIKLACVVANTYVEIYYRLILSILLDYSFIHGLKYPKLHKSLSFACRSNHVKFTTVALPMNILSWSYTKSIYFILLHFLN